MKGIQFLYIFYDEQDKQQIQLEYKKLSYPLYAPCQSQCHLCTYMTKSPYIFSHLAKCNDNHSLGIRFQVLFLGNHQLMKAQNQVWNVQ